MENSEPMLHSALVYQIKKSRGINWTPSEKEFLMRLCSQRINTIEDKKSDLATLSKKAAAWKYIHSKFSARFGRKRTPIRIKEQWKRMKIAARAELRDRGEKPEVGATPVDPNAVTNKYYGENLDIISKVQEILFSENPPKFSDDTEENNTEFQIKSEPMCEYTEATEYPESHGTNSFISENSLEHVDSNMFIYNNTPFKETNSYPHELRDSGECHYNKSSTVPQTSIPRVPQVRETNILNSLQSILVAKRIATAGESRNGASLNHVSPNAHNTSNGSTKQSKTVEERLLEYARIEHARKMEIMEKEHALQMEILTMQRDIAAAKLKKANYKLDFSRSVYS